MENCGWASDLASTLEYPFRVFRFSWRSSAFWISVVPFFLLSISWSSLFIKTDFIIFWINDFYVYIGLSLYSSCGTFSVQNRSRNLTPKSIWVLLFAFLSNLLPNILTSDFWYHLILRKTFYPCVSQIKNICETIFICTLDCPFRLDSVCPFVSGSQIGFVLTIYEKGTIEYIYKELPLMIFNCQTKNSLIFLNLNLAKQLSDFLNEIWFSLHQMNSSLNSYSLFSNLSEFNFRFFHFINQTVGSHPINPFQLRPEAVSNNSVGRKAVRFICHWNQSFLFWIGTLFVPDMMFFSLS